MSRFAALLLFCCVSAATCVLAADQPQWGVAWTRNMVSSEVDLPAEFDPGVRNRQTGGIDLPPGSRVQWVVPTGSETCGTPIVADGRVYVGTNNGQPRDPRYRGDRGVLLCLDEQTGRLLWQLVVPKLTTVKWGDWRMIGLTSPPTVEGDRLYVVTNRDEVLCLDVHGMADGNQGPFTDEARLLTAEGEPPITPGPTDADVLWRFDVIAETGAEPHNGSNCSLLLDGNLLYACTSNGVDWTHKRVLNPAAPSLIVLDKRDGRLVGVDDFQIGPDITHGQWSSPAMATVDGQKLVFFGAGNGVLYAARALDESRLDGAALPVKLENVFRFHGHPLAQEGPPPPADHQHDSTSYQMTAMPVFHDGKLYCVFTQEPFHGMRDGWLACLDATGRGDVTRSALRWSYPALGSSVSTPAVHDGLVYAADFFGTLHCLDADSGRVLWTHDVGRPVWASPLVADGKVYLATGREVLWTLRAGRQKEVLARTRLHDAVHCSPTAANGTLYVATRRHLYAVEKGE